MPVSTYADLSQLPRPWRGQTIPYANITNLARNYANSQVDQQDPMAQYLSQLGSQSMGQAAPSQASQELMGRLSGHSTSATTSGVRSTIPSNAQATTMGAGPAQAGNITSPYLQQLQQIGQQGALATTREQNIANYQAAQRAAAAAARGGGGGNTSIGAPDLSGVSGARAKIIAAARSQLRVPYVWGGETPGKAFDCSGLVQYAFRQAGIKLPRVSQDQMTMGVRTSIKNLLPGDLLGVGHPAHHIMIYLGGGRAIEAPHTGDVVKIINIAGYSGLWGIHLKI